jgi:hypothetical protein
MIMLTYKINETDITIKYAISVNRYEHEYGYHLIDEHLTTCTYLDIIDATCIGKIYAVAKRSPDANAGSYPDTLIFRDDDETITSGWAGNSNPNIRKHYGWRGTTDNIGIYAMGIAKLIKYTQHPRTYRTVLVFEKIPVAD